MDELSERKKRDRRYFALLALITAMLAIGIQIGLRAPALIQRLNELGFF